MKELKSYEPSLKQVKLIRSKSHSMNDIECEVNKAIKELTTPTNNTYFNTILDIKLVCNDASIIVMIIYEHNKK